MTSAEANGGDDSINPYLAMREAKIARNQKRLLELGLVKPLPPAPKQQATSKQTQRHREPVRRSNRVSSFQKKQPGHEEGVSLPSRTTFNSRKAQMIDTLPHLNISVKYKESSPALSASAPAPHSVRSISLDVKSLVHGQIKEGGGDGNGLLGKMLEHPGKEYVLHESFAKAAYPEDRQRFAEMDKKLSFNKYSGVLEWKVSFLFLFSFPTF